MEPVSSNLPEAIRKASSGNTQSCPEENIRFSVIIPLEFHRGQAVDCLRGWATEQTYPREQFEIILGCPPGFPEDELDCIRPLLAAHDQILHLSGEHDMALCAEAAHRAHGKILFFTESHCTPESDTLHLSNAALDEHLDWDGFSCRSVPITHNLLSQIEAELYEKDIAFAMNEHPWRKVLDQCFVIRRQVYHDVGGFEAELGHFAEWLLAARLYKAGYKIGYAPDIRIRHFYLGVWSEWHEFTKDFSKGQMLFLARGTSEPCSDMFDELPEWISRTQADRATACRMLKLLLRDMTRICSGVQGTKLRLKAIMRWNWRGLWNWSARALFGGRTTIMGCFFQERWAKLCLSWNLFRKDKPKALLAIRDCCQAITTSERAKFLVNYYKVRKSLSEPDQIGMANSRSFSSPTVLPGMPATIPLVGFHLQEELSSTRFRWSEPTAMIELPLEPGKYLVTLRWHPSVQTPKVSRIRFYLNETLIPGNCVNHKLSRVEIQLDLSRIQNSEGLRLGWVCESVQTRADQRKLGLPVSSIEWKPIGPTTEPSHNMVSQPEPELPQPRLLFIHIRKTAGVSMRNLLENRFCDADHLFQAHSRQRPPTDPGYHQFVTGHVNYGYVSRFEQKPLVFSVVRDPVERALSTFYFFRENGEQLFENLKSELTPQEYAERRRITQLASQLSLYDFLKQEPQLARRHLSNIQTRSFLSGAHLERHRELGPTDLAKALVNLSDCDVVGLTEKLPETLKLLEFAMGWEGLGPIQRCNPTRDRRLLCDEEPRVVEILSEWNQYDAEIYSAAKTRFERQLQQLRSSTVSRRHGYDLSLPKAEQFTFDQPIHGWGWQVRERVNDCWICWAGACETAWLDLKIDKAVASTLRCYIHSVIAQRVLNSLRIQVNDQPISHSCQLDGMGFVLECEIPRETVLLNDGFVRISFNMQQGLRPCDIQPGVNDDRTLGIAFEEIDFRPSQKNSGELSNYTFETNDSTLANR